MAYPAGGGDFQCRLSGNHELSGTPPQEPARVCGKLAAERATPRVAQMGADALPSPADSPCPLTLGPGGHQVLGLDGKPDNNNRCKRRWQSYSMSVAQVLAWWCVVT